jgi:hypothetical protein
MSGRPQRRRGFATVGAGQTERRNTGTGTAGGDVRGPGSTEAGASSVTMSWTLGLQSRGRSAPCRSDLSAAWSSSSKKRACLARGLMPAVRAQSRTATFRAPARPLTPRQRGSGGGPGPHVLCVKRLRHRTASGRPASDCDIRSRREHEGLACRERRTSKARWPRAVPIAERAKCDSKCTSKWVALAATFLTLGTVPRARLPVGAGGIRAATVNRVRFELDCET